MTWYGCKIRLSICIICASVFDVATSNAIAAEDLRTRERSSRPNIVVILTDDQGFADISLNQHHPLEVSTPNMDSLAQDGVQFEQAYTSGHVCSPTRAGLMLGRYQQRVGVYSAGDGGRGFDPELPLFPSFLPDEYVSAAIGKWHLGLDEDYPALKWHALNRGFDECYKFMGRGGHSYFDLRSDTEGKFNHPIYRNKERINDEGYLTDRLSEEAVAFIDRHKKQPFFLYLAYNAVHAPPEAPQTDIDYFREKFPDLSEERVVLMAMLKRLDDGIGSVISKLKQEQLFQNTLVFFLTDNGGSKAMSADNTPLRGYKGSLQEGGIRTPMIVSWPAAFQGGRSLQHPVISLDILPTALDATGQLATDNDFDGKSLLPLLTEQSNQHHETLYWCKDGGEQAVRRGDWKLRVDGGEIELFNLRSDPSETKNLAERRPDQVQELGRAFDRWLADMAAPITGGDKPSSNFGNSKAAGTINPTPDNPKTRRRKDRTRSKNTPSDAEAEKPELTSNPVTEDQAKNTTSSRPNVLLIVCDDLNTHVSTSEYPHIVTPAFDALAAAGMTFKRAYCQYPVCGPSRASFLSGLYPESTAVLDNTSDIRQTRPGTISLPQRFHDAGYWTASVGKVFHNPKTDPGDTAWHEVRRFENDELPLVTSARLAFEQVHGSIEERDNRQRWRSHLTSLSTQTRGQQKPGFGPSGLRDEQHKDGKNVRQVAQWLKSKPHGNQPFFIACGIQKPHVPFLAPDGYFDMYPQAGLRFQYTPSNFWDHVPKLAMVKRYQQFGFELGVENDALRRQYTQAYHACISFIDAQIGLLLDALKKNGDWNNTIIILTSDHGYQLGEHFMWGKVTLFETCARVPFLIRVPHLTTAGSSSGEIIELVDLYPTLAELCSVPPPSILQGQSLVPMLSDAKAAGKDYAYTVVTRGDRLGRAIRAKDYRYAKWADGEELYDLRSDPSEFTNLAASPSHADVLTAMRAALAKRQTIIKQ